MTRSKGRSRSAIIIVCFACFLVWLPAAGVVWAQTSLVDRGADWRYLDDGSDPGTAWIDPAFDDSSWASGPAQLGYGEGDESTVLDFGPDPLDKYITSYFRHSFNVDDPGLYASVDLGFLRDDGGIVYVNGVEVFRSNMHPGAVAFDTLASIAIAGIDETTFFPISLNPNLLVAGINVIAAEVHQADWVSSDQSFDLELTATSGNRITRGPYLQKPTSDGIVVRWRSVSATDSRVEIGDAPGNLSLTFDEGTLTDEHEVELSGLQPDTRYYYSVGSSTEVLAGNDALTFFVTPPLSGTSRAARIWVVGDSGTADANVESVRDAYAAFTGTTHTDLFLMLGDNAYNDGTDAEYQAAVFDMFPSILRQTPVYPTVGNHNVASQSWTQTGPYFDMFTLPADGAAGGVASGTEAYYSFDYGNVHFVVLNSHDINRSPGAPMWSWLDLDLAETTQDWIVAYWHHPPYSRGSHDSDNPTGSDGNLEQMRQEALPILESMGVDLVLAGHSHSYERSFLLDGHYGHSSTLDGSMVLDGGSGSWSRDESYAKATAGPAPHEGAVYVVAGSSGLITGGALNHPAMFTAHNRLGSVVLDVDGDRLDGFFLDSTGAVFDQFTLLKAGAQECSATTLVQTGSTWSYLDDGSDQGGAWTALEFDDSTWASGPAELGYGDADEATVVGFGSDPNNKYITTYLRHAFEVPDASIMGALELKLLRDDGAVVYLNGTEAFRHNLAAGSVTSGTPASVSVAGVDETTFFGGVIDPALLMDGGNVLAVEVHQATAASTDLSFDLSLVGADCSLPQVDPTLIFADDFEGGNLSAWSSSRTDGGDLSVSGAAAMAGALGLEALIDDRNPIWVQDDTPESESSYRVKFSMDPNGLGLPNKKSFPVLRGLSNTSGRALLVLALRFKNGDYQLRGQVRNDASTTRSPWVVIPDQVIEVEAHWRAASAPGAEDGSLTLSIDGVPVFSQTGLDNDLRLIDYVRFGATAGIDSGTAGTLLLDEFESYRE